MISDTINKEIATALKKQDKLRVSVLRMLSSAINYKRIEKQQDLSKEEEILVVKAEAKKRKDAIEIYRKVQNEAQVKEKLEREKEELKILKEYLPEEMSDNEISKLAEAAIKETGAKTLPDMGKVIGLVMKKSKGRADGAKVSALVKSKLTS
jgi:uncharacterized protein YqeY